ncbi:S8 family serine peptidase [Actinoplanes sp. RD1]|uniref:S8 family serine peptidase n=1 Tax=Actinoplanes sp. RD1 TaxID=3064538 RepID=UPI002742791B|nr:S8 family serine peptidase [Actinoplanes sp. RD1]
MNKRIARRAIAGALSLGVVAAGAVAAQPGASADETKVRLVVGLQDGVDSSAAVKAAAAFGGKATDLVAQAREALASLNARTLEVPASKQSVVMAALRAQPGVEYVEVDQKGASTQDVRPNDPEYVFGYQPEVDRVKLPAAWQTTTGSNVKVAVLDTGVNKYADIANAVTTGYNYVSNTSNTTDNNGHGTAVSSLIAGRGNDEVGMAGSCWQCTIIPVKVLDAKGNGYWSDVAKGITYAANKGASVINLSLGGASGAKVLQDAVIYAQAKGALVVASAGNNGGRTKAPYATTKMYPAAYAEVLGVGATARGTNTKASYSSYNKKGDTWVDIGAPGDDLVLGYTPNKDYPNDPKKGTYAYEIWSGTSFAAPMVSGAAALVKSVHPNYNGWSLQRAILSSGHTIPANGWAKFGLLDDAKALTMTTDGTVPTVSITSPGQGARVHGTVTLKTTAGDNWSGVRYVDFYVEGKYQARDMTAPFQWGYNTKTHANGRANYTVRAYDKAGNVAVATRYLTVDNTLPTVWIAAAPASNTKVKGKVTVEAGAYDLETGIQRVDLLINGKVKKTDTTKPYSFTFEASAQPATFKVQFKAVDYAGNVHLSGTRTLKR